MLRARTLVVAVGIIGLGLAASSAEAAPFALVGSTLDETVTVIDTATAPTATATIPLSGTPTGVSVNPVRREAYVGALTADAAAVLLVLRTDLLAQVSEIPLSVLEPTDVAVNAAGTRAYVTGGFNDNLVSVVNLDTRAEIGTITVGPLNTPPGPVGVVAHPTLARLYVVNSNTGTVSVVDTGSNTVVTTITLTPCPLGCAPLEAALTPTGGLLFVTDFFADSVWVVNTATNAIVRSVALPFGAQPEGIDAHPDGTRVYVAHLAGDGGGMLTAISTAGTNPILGNVSVGANPLGVAVHPSGAAVYVVNEGDDTVTVATTASLSDQLVVPVGASPSTVGRFITAPPAPPTVTSFTPTSGAVGTQVTITGTNLDGASVTFTGPVTVTPTAVTATSLKATVPAGALTGPISVASAAGTATSATAFKVLPQITGFTPASAVAGSGTLVVVSGNNLRAATGTPVVKVGAFTVTSLNASTLTELQFTVPLGATTGKISVTTVDGAATSVTDLVVVQPPRITALTPAMGPVGTAVTVGGTNLLGATAVTFTGPVTVTPTAVTATSLKATVPVGALTGPVSVTNPAGTGTSTTAFKVAPQITGFTPPSAVAGSGTLVTVTGNNLRAAAGNPVVKIGAFTVTSLNASSLTELQLTVPLGAVTGKISVTTVDGTATAATDLVVIQPPRITGLTPAAAPVGVPVTIAGTNLLGVTDVTFTGPVTVTPTAVTATSVKAVVPVGALTGPVSVTNPAGTALSAVALKVIPRITGFAPSTVVAGSDTPVVVTGNNLRAGTGEPAVKVGTVPVPATRVLSSTATELRFTVPLGAVTGRINITTLDGLGSSAVSLTVLQPPRVTSFTPATAPVGTSVTIAGAFLDGAAAVTFTGPVSVTPTAVTGTSVKATVPAGALTGPVSITNSLGTGTGTAVFKVAPRITGFTPPSAVAGSATLVTVTGNNLRAATGNPVVKIGAFTVASLNASSLTELQFTVPLGAVTGQISVTTIDGIATAATDLVVIQPPKITGLTPAAAPVGATLTIAGTSLLGATSVTFTGPVSVTPTAVTATSVKAIVPIGALTGPVSVTNAIGTGVSAVALKLIPAITGLSPASAVAGSNTPIVVSGNNLRAATGEPLVKIGTFAVPASQVLSSTATELRFTIPLGAVTGKISIATLDGAGTSVANLTVIQPPKVTSFAPATGPVGTVVTLAGMFLDGATAVTFTGPVTVTPTAVTSTSLKVMVPVGASTGAVSVTNPVGTGTSTSAFKVAPKITDFAPPSALPGTVVTLNGFNLRAASGEPVVKIGALTVPSLNASTATQLQFTVPATALTGKLSVTTIDGVATSATDFRVIKPPTVASFTPASGRVGTLVTITGTNFLDATEVLFNGVSAGAPTVLSATSLRVAVPPGATTGKIAVTNPASSAQSAGNFTVTP